jgi:hypothetical protein
MWNIPKQKQLDAIPRLYETESIPLAEKKVYLHFFVFGSDWYITEYDGNDIFFGYAILNGDIMNAEWGYVSFSELKSIKVGFVEIDCDLHWEVVPAKKVPLINCG